MKQTDPRFVPTSTPLGAADVLSMAALLVDKHGTFAVNVARFTALEHALYDDHARGKAWQAVTSTAADIISGRLKPGTLRIH